MRKKGGLDDEFKAKTRRRASEGFSEYSPKGEREKDRNMRVKIKLFILLLEKNR